LYNIAEDIGEQHNRAEENPEKTKELAVKLGNYLQSVDAQQPIHKASGKLINWSNTFSNEQ